MQRRSLPVVGPMLGWLGLMVAVLAAVAATVPLAGAAAASAPPPAAGGLSSPLEAAGSWHACGLHTDGSAVCWGANDYGQTVPPAATWKTITSGMAHSCGIRSDDSVACWGYNNEGESNAPTTGSYTAVTAGGYHTCALRTDGTAVCWGMNNAGQATPPAGTWTQISAGGSHTCAVRANSTMACWGNWGNGQINHPFGPWAAVSSGKFHSCGLHTDGTIQCWGDNSNGQSTPPAGTFTAVSAGSAHSCGIRPDHTATCWGANGFGQTAVPAGTWASITTGDAFTCGVHVSGTAECWGDNRYGQTGKITSLAPPPAVIGQPYDHTITSNLPGATVAITQGALPAGLALVANHVIGTPTATGTSHLVISATDGTFPGGQLGIALVVFDSTITTPPPSPSGPDVDIAFAATGSANGSFGCALDGAAFTVCLSPLHLTGLLPGSHTFRVQASVSGVVDTTPATTTWTVEPAGGTFHLVTQRRLLDTRLAPAGPVVAGNDRSLPVAGFDPVPATATAVVLNVTVTNPTTASFLTVYPSGNVAPTTSNLNFGAGATVANLVTVAVGNDRAIAFANASGNTDVVVDVVGYYDPTPSLDASYLRTLTPARLLDSRTTTGGWPGPIGAGDGNTRTLQVTGRGGVPTSATAVVLNVTATNATAGSYLSVWPTGPSKPNTSTVNFSTGQSVANLATVGLGVDGSISVFDAVGTTDVVIDVIAYFDPTGGALYHPMSPVRVLDDRSDVGLSGPWGPKQARSLRLSGVAGIGTSAVAVVMNVTLTNPSQPTVVAVTPGATTPTTSNVNVLAGQTVPNLVLVGIGPTGAVTITNDAGSVDVIADAQGYFASF